MLVHSAVSTTKKAFFLLSIWPGTECTWKKSLLICFESYQGIPYSHLAEYTDDGENFANG